MSAILLTKPDISRILQVNIASKKSVSLFLVIILYFVIKFLIIFLILTESVSIFLHTVMCLPS